MRIDKYPDNFTFFLFLQSTTRERENEVNKKEKKTKEKKGILFREWSLVTDIRQFPCPDWYFTTYVFLFFLGKGKKKYPNFENSQKCATTE